MADAKTKQADELVEVRIPRKDYDAIQKKRAKEQMRSGRMSLRIPYDLNQMLTAKHRKTRKPKTAIVLDALKTALAPNIGVLD